MIDLAMLVRAEEKIRLSKVKRYYILTTHKNCTHVDSDMEIIIDRVYKEHGCQIIVNGVIPTIKYYLRLVSKPSEALGHYSKLLTTDRAIRFEHVQKWEEIVKSFS